MTAWGICMYVLQKVTCTIQNATDEGHWCTHEISIERKNTYKAMFGSYHHSYPRCSAKEIVIKAGWVVWPGQSSKSTGLTLHKARGTHCLNRYPLNKNRTQAQRLVFLYRTSFVGNTAQSPFGRIKRNTLFHDMIINEVKLCLISRMTGSRILDDPVKICRAV